jgi:tRNA(fMet)-specific endonuclease VapC
MPISGRVLLDTNIVIAALEGDARVLSNLEQAVKTFIPVTAFGELFFGAAKSGRPAENIARLERIASTASILPCDLAVARQYGAIKYQLRKKGRPLPENDMWIAAAAKCHDLVLITRPNGEAARTFHRGQHGREKSTQAQGTNGRPPQTPDPRKSSGSL